MKNNQEADNMDRTYARDVQGCDEICVKGFVETIRNKKTMAFIVLKEGIEKNDETKQELMEYCKSKFAKYAKPNEIEFRDSLPQTKIGKTDYRKLEEEEKKKNA